MDGGNFLRIYLACTAQLSAYTHYRSCCSFQWRRNRKDTSPSQRACIVEASHGELWCSVASAASGGGPLEVLVAGTHLVLSLGAEGLHAIPTVQSLSDLLVCVDETLKLAVQLDVLAGEHVAVVLESVDFGAHIGITSLH